jgi:shikimate kinase
MNIFLIGFMGSGKSTIGKLLSQKFQMKFADLDTIIEQNQGKLVGEIFKDFGESKFRELEHDMLLEITNSDNQVVSVGGGTPCFFRNMELMNQKGLTIYLKMSAEAILNRLDRLPPSAKALRPLLANKSKPELTEFIVSTLGKREEFYNRAKIIVFNEISDTHVALERISTAILYNKESERL